MLPQPFGHRLLRPRRTLHSHLRIGYEQPLRGFLAGALRHVLICFLQMRRTLEGMVRIGGHKMNPVPLQQLVG